MLTIEHDKTNDKFSLLAGSNVLRCEIEECVGTYIQNEQETVKALELYFEDEETYKFVLANYSELLNRVHSFILPNYIRWKGVYISAAIEADEEWICNFIIKFDDEWKNNFLTDDYVSQIANNKNHEVISIEFEGEPRDWKAVFLSNWKSYKEIDPLDLFKETAFFVNNFHNEAVYNLINLQKDTFISYFNFPQNLKIPCEQYLLYFAQFLRDLGINATSNLKEEAGKVLFSVTPTDEIEALDKIREALAVYLNLPSSPIVYDDSFAAMRLQQQIENLEHSQKMAVREIQLAEKVIMIQSETIREKNTIISQKDSTIEQQSKIIGKISSKSIMMDSVQNKEELEEIYDGLKVGESETLKKWLGISLNPAKVINTAVKNTFGQDGEKKSVLGLDEESD